MFRVVRHGIERVEGEPLFGEVERVVLEAGLLTAQFVQLLLRVHDHRSAGEDVFDVVEGDVIVVAFNAREQVEPDDGPLRFVGIGFVARDAALVARVERLAVVALKIVVSAVERVDGGDERRIFRVIAVVVVTGSKRCAGQGRDKE